MQLFYATRDGQARRIAERIASRLGEHGIAVAPQDLAEPSPLAGNAPVVVVAAVRYGKHLPEAERFFARLSKLTAPPPLVLLSVNLTARKPGRDSLEGCTYLRKSIRRHKLRPTLALAFAGRLDYASYGWLDRQMIRIIMLLTGGPTDPKTSIEYTSWDKVDAVVRQIAGLCTAR
jgi:menaquinone-dependent protoporphyrinogen oxidase